MNIDEINRLHDSGDMPDWVWTQLNGRSAQENYMYIKEKQRREFREEQRQKQQDAALEKYMSEMIEKKLGVCLEKTLDDLLKDFK